MKFEVPPSDYKPPTLEATRKLLSLREGACVLLPVRQGLGRVVELKIFKKFWPNLKIVGVWVASSFAVAGCDGRMLTGCFASPPQGGLASTFGCLVAANW